jgi:hypothetical protein
MPRRDYRDGPPIRTETAQIFFAAMWRRRRPTEVVRPLQEKQETVYVVPGSDAEDHVARRFPLKTIKRVGHGLRHRTIAPVASMLDRKLEDLVTTAIR